LRFDARQSETPKQIPAGKNEARPRMFQLAIHAFERKRMVHEMAIASPIIGIAGRPAFS
jgi:hypothetical protein